MRAHLVLAGVVLLTTAGCGTVGSASVPDPSPPTQALTAWKDFPANQRPRPIVLLADVTPGQGFDTNDGKIAALCGKFSLGVSLPTETPKLAVATWPGGMRVTYAAASAFAAFDDLKKGGAAEPDCASVAALQVTAVRFADAEFATDRGTARISAWLFRTAGAWAEFPVIGVVGSALWGGGYTRGSMGVGASGGATASSDGLTLKYEFVGGDCDAGYKFAIAESTSAVAVRVVPIPKDGMGQVCDAVGYARSIVLTLANPLGGRVLIDDQGGVEAAQPG